jgi:predicted component of type VI protein secretion system
MKLEKLLSEKGPAILDKWLKLILESYPADTQRFLKKQKDPFANPIRHTISKEIENIYKELLKGVDREAVSPFLDRIIRIRAVQDFSPSQAIAFVFQLKKVIREALDKEIRELSAKEARNQVYRLLHKKGLLAEIPEWQPHLTESNNS